MLTLQAQKDKQVLSCLYSVHYMSNKLDEKGLSICYTKKFASFDEFLTVEEFKAETPDCFAVLSISRVQV